MAEKRLDVDLEKIRIELFVLELDSEQRCFPSNILDNGMLDVYINLRFIDLHILSIEVQAVHGIEVGTYIVDVYVPNDINDKHFFVDVNYHLVFQIIKQENVEDVIDHSNFYDILDKDVFINFLFIDVLDSSNIRNLRMLLRRVVKLDLSVQVDVERSVDNDFIVFVINFIVGFPTKGKSLVQVTNYDIVVLVDVSDTATVD